MDTRLLIHSIVRQTTVLLAQVSTAAGLRAPLAHVANQVFLDLARELEAQGVRRNVVADMFGLALRSYQLKFQRALAAAGEQRSLWREVYEVLAAGAVTRQQLEAQFPTVDAKGLTAVLHDLVESGIAYRSGRGRRAVFGLTPERDLVALQQEDDDVSLSHLVWLKLATQGQRSAAALAAELNVTPEQLERALGLLLGDGRIEHDNGTYDACSFDIPVGAEFGWEVAVCDHFRAIANAIGAKLSDPQSRQDDRIGGTTLTFAVHAEHPRAAEVYGLLARFRNELNPLWEAVSAYNSEQGVPPDADQVTFYFGQNLTRGAADEPDGPGADPPEAERELPSEPRFHSKSRPEPPPEEPSPGTR